MLNACSNLSSYLKTLDRDKMKALFAHPATCLAVFRFGLDHTTAPARPP